MIPEQKEARIEPEELKDELIILQRPEYEAAAQALREIEDNSKLHPLDNFFRYIFSFNAGIGTGSLLYYWATAISATIPVMAISGGCSLLLCIFIANYFLNSYSVEDEGLMNKIKKYTQKVNFLAQDEFKLTQLCHIKIIKLIKIKESYPEIDFINHEVQPLHSLHEDIAALTTADYTEKKLLMTYLDKWLSYYQNDISLIKKVKKINLARQDSIYTKVFHGGIWGPILSFFGASGTFFGVTSTILKLVGITVLAGSGMWLSLTILSGAILLGSLLALKHFFYDKKSKKRENQLADFKQNHLDELTIRVDKIKHLYKDLAREIERYKGCVKEAALAKEKPELANAMNIKIKSIDQSDAHFYRSFSESHLSQYSLFANEEGKISVSPSPELSMSPELSK